MHAGWFAADKARGCRACDPAYGWTCAAGRHGWHMGERSRSHSRAARRLAARPLRRSGGERSARLAATTGSAEPAAGSACGRPSPQPAVELDRDCGEITSGLEQGPLLGQEWTIVGQRENAENRVRPSACHDERQVTPEGGTAGRDRRDIERWRGAGHRPRDRVTRVRDGVRKPGTRLRSEPDRADDLEALVAGRSGRRPRPIQPRAGRRGRQGEPGGWLAGPPPGPAPRHRQPGSPARRRTSLTSLARSEAEQAGARGSVGQRDPS